MPKSDMADVIIEVFEAINEGSMNRAREISRRKYPWEAKTLVRRSMSQSKSLQIFRRDGFIDRYFESRLVFPGALLLLGQLLPDCFPMHENWQVAHSHIVFWELWPVVDHLVPITRGGSNDEDNLVTTSELHNSAKAQWTIQEIGWELNPPGNLSEWDGLFQWSLDWFENNPSFQPEVTLANWIKVARNANI